jgi:hypothetical protein
MSYERTEAYLRVMAEAELRRAASGNAVDQGFASKLTLVGQALCIAGALEVRTVREIQADLGVARAIRPSSATRGQLARAMDFQLALASDAASASIRDSGPLAPRNKVLRVVRVDRAVQIRYGEVQYQLHVLSYVQTAGGTWLMARMLAHEPAVQGGETPSPEAAPGRLFLAAAGQITAEDDHGTVYRLSLAGGKRGGRLGWPMALKLSSNPSPAMRWLDLRGAPGTSPARVRLGNQSPLPDVTVAETATTGGELVVHIIAARLLAATSTFPQETLEELAAAKPGLVPHIPSGLGDTVTALLAAGTLPPSSPLPGQLARLCASLGISGHGITAPAAGDLPAPWLSIVTRYGQRLPRPGPALESWAPALAELPELDGVKLLVLGLHSTEDGTVLRVLACGVTPEDDWEYYRGVRPLPVLWIRDSNGHWHAAQPDGWTRLSEDECMLRLTIIPSLEATVTGIEVVAMGASARCQVTLPLRWI